MKRHYASAWLLLLAAFVIFAVSSAFEMPEVMGYRLKSSGVADALRGDSVTAPAVPVSAPDADDAEPPVMAPCDTTAQCILFIGDSMLEGLAPRLAAYAEKNGHTLYTVTWYSSTSEVWGRSDKLATYIRRLRPSYVFVCLGANELFVNDIERKRARYVEKIVADIDTIPFLWIGPPNWRKDTGINALIASRTPRGSFFLSDGMSFERGRDGAHPTRESAAAWLDSVVRWMPENARYPIRLDVPDKPSGRARRSYVHQPGER
ncbi:MAG: SGNH/GDSL hydrolase family protein [Muribaculaceae bacterium]|jgi:hypothetical protein|nr:SGNH/GDSL hydrolase family protein [Muribaculaceae bacterium]